MPLVAVSFVAAGGIAYEILLMRLYAIVQWHHFAFMVISIALLGFGLSGTVLALARGWALRRFVPLWQANAAAFGLLAVAAFVLAQRLPVNPMELAWQPRLFGRVALAYLLLMLPFFCAANCIGLAFARFGEESGRVYRFDLLGSGLGAAVVVAVLFALAPQDALRLLPPLGFVAAALAGLGGRGAGRWRRAAALLLAGLAAGALIPDEWLALRISQYKGLPQALDLPGAEVVQESSSPLGLVTVVHSPERPFRHAPGLSLASPVPPPEQLGLFVDGGGMSAIARFEGDREKLAYLDYTTQAAPYHLLERPSVLVLGLGGGSGVLLAERYHDARRVDAVELNPAVVELLRRDFAGYAGDLLGPGDVRAHVAEARAFVAGAAARYDLIQLPILESFGAAAAGLGGLQETYAYTVEAFGDYLEHLEPGGILAVSRWLRLPPRDALKAFATAIAALERRGLARPGERLALLRGWNTTTLLVKNGRFAEADVAALEAFARQRNFDLAYYPGMRRAEANRFNVLEQPYFYDGATALLGRDRERFLARYKFDLRPATDDRPYFFDFAKWWALPELLALRARGAMPLIEWGALVLVATLAQAAALSVVLILGPLAALRRRGGKARGHAAVAVYFLALGLAFLFVEIAFIKRLVLFLGHPIYAVAVVLAAFLVFAGLGAGLSPRLAGALRGRPRLEAVDVAVAAILAMGAFYLLVLPTLLQALVGLAPPLKVGLALAVLAPVAFAMGMPFPLALVRLARGAPALVPWAWGINGCASVVSAVLAALLAMQFGFAAVVASALALYVVAAAAFRRLP